MATVQTTRREFLIGTAQERRAFPSTSTVHEPHCASPHPNFGPCKPRLSRST